MKAAILLSGGMDSIALAFWKRPQFGITIDYGHAPALAELAAAEQVCKELGIEHICIRIDLSSIGSGDLSGSVPLDIAPCPEWWPFRNQMLVTIAAMKAIAIDVNILYIGTVATDRIHADGTVEFSSQMNTLLKMQEGSLSLEAPASGYRSSELIKLSHIPIELLSWAHSCHTGNYACGTCRGCNKHRETWFELGHEPY